MKQRLSAPSLIKAVVVLAVTSPAWAVGAGAQAVDRPARLEADRASREQGSDLLWYDARELTIEGRAWSDTELFFERLPARAKGKVTSSVWSLSKHTAGIAVRFVTDSPRIDAAWDGGPAMNHMAATGNSGLDLYCRTDEGWEFCGVGRPQPQRTIAQLVGARKAEPTEYLLYLPLYQRVTELKLGIAAEAMIAPAPARPASKAKPIVFYGTSITQGGCASRAGMCHPAMLGRWLDREVVNLGFSGSGKMEPEIAELLGELDPAMFVLETLPNMTTEMVRERVEPFVKMLRKARPATPIVLVEHPRNPENNPSNHALRRAFETLKGQGVGGLYYLPGKDQLVGPENGTVDGTHPTDLGFFRMAVAYRPLLEEVLSAHP